MRIQVRRGAIMRYANERPVFIDETEPGRGTCAIDFESEIARGLVSIEKGKRIARLPTGIAYYDDEYLSCGGFKMGVECTSLQVASACSANDLPSLGRSYERELAQWWSANASKVAQQASVCYAITDKIGGKKTDRGWIITTAKGNLLAVKTLGDCLQRQENAMVMSEATRVLTAQDLVCDEIVLRWNGTSVEVRNEGLATQLRVRLLRMSVVH